MTAIMIAVIGQMKADKLVQQVAGLVLILMSLGVKTLTASIVLYFVTVAMTATMEVMRLTVMLLPTAPLEHVHRSARSRRCRLQ